MKIDESLARGLCSRFFVEANDNLENLLRGNRRVRALKKTRAGWARFVKDIRLALSEVALIAYEGGSARRPYFAFCGLHIDNSRDMGHWSERAIQGKQVFFDLERNAEYFDAPFSIGEHAITRMIERGDFNIQQKTGFNVLGILDGFDHVSLWAAFWSRLGIYLKAKGLAVDLIEPIIPSRSGLFLCRLSVDAKIIAAPVVEIRTFVDNSLLSNEQSWVQRKMLAASKGLIASPLALFPLMDVFELDDSFFLERVVHFKLRGVATYIASLVTGLIETEAERSIMKDAIVAINQELSEYVTVETILLIEEIGIRRAQVEVRSASLRLGG